MKIEGDFLEWYEDFLDILYSKNTEVERFTQNEIKGIAFIDFENSLTPKQSADCFILDNF